METFVLQQPVAASNAPAPAAPFTELVDDYMRAYAGRDRTRVYQLAWWGEYLGARPFVEITEDEMSPRMRH